MELQKKNFKEQNFRAGRGRQRNWTTLTKLAAGALAGALLVSCGGGSSPVQSDVNVGYFIDAAVEGLRYETDTLTGTTDQQGAFQYRTGETVRFYVNNQPIGTSTGRNYVHVFDVVAPGSLSSSRASGIQIGQLLQSLDSDLNPENGITISPTLAALLSSNTIRFNKGDTQFRSDFANIFASTPVTLVTAQDAEAHLNRTYQEYSAQLEASCPVPHSQFALPSIDGEYGSYPTVIADSSRQNLSCDQRGAIVAYKNRIQATLGAELDELAEKEKVLNDFAGNPERIEKETRRSAAFRAVAFADDAAKGLEDLTKTGLAKRGEILLKSTMFIKAMTRFTKSAYELLGTQPSLEADNLIDSTTSLISVVADYPGCIRFETDACLDVALNALTALERESDISKLSPSNRLALKASLEIALVALQSAIDQADTGLSKKERATKFSSSVTSLVASSSKLWAARVTSNENFLEGFESVVDITEGFTKSLINCPSASSDCIASVRQTVEDLIPLGVAAISVFEYRKLYQERDTLLLMDRFLREYVATGSDFAAWAKKYYDVDSGVSCWFLNSVCTTRDDDEILLAVLLKVLAKDGELPFSLFSPPNLEFDRFARDFKSNALFISTSASTYASGSWLDLNLRSIPVGFSAEISVSAMPSRIDAVSCIASGDGVPDAFGFPSQSAAIVRTISWSRSGVHSVTCTGTKGADVIARITRAVLLNPTRNPAVFYIEPTTAPVGQTIVFTVVGRDFPISVVASIADASCGGSGTITANSFQVSCKLAGSTGAKTVTIKTDLASNYGIVIDDTKIVSATAALPGIAHPTNGSRYEKIDCGTWTQCDAAARARGGHLVTIRSEDEVTWLVSTFPTTNDYGYWIGYRRIVGTWGWSSGDTSTFTHWETGEPNGAASSHDYAHMYGRNVGGARAGRWNDTTVVSLSSPLTTQAIVEYR